MADFAREQPKEVSLPPRLPLVGVIDERPGETGRDGKLVNAYVERTEDGELHIIKRPGLELRYAFGSDRFGAGMFGNFFFFQGNDGAGSKFYLYNTETLLSSAIGATTQARTPGRLAYFVNSLNFAGKGYVFHTQSAMYAYLIDTSEVLPIPFANATLGPHNFVTTNGSTVISTTPPKLLPIYSGITGAGMQPGTTLLSRQTLAGPPPLVETYTLSLHATANSAAASLTINAAGPNARTTFATSSVFSLVPGIVDLNAATFVMNNLSEVTNSDRGDCTKWNPLSLIRAYLYESPPMRIARQLGYVIVFKEVATEFFRDAGISPGSPLARQEGMTLEVGLANSNTLAEADGYLFWCSKAESGRKSAWMMSGGRPKEIAPPAVSRVLSRSNPDNGHCFSISGHLFYALSDPTEPYTLVYDVASNFWSYWEALDEGYWPFVASTRWAGETLLQHRTNGNIYQLREDVLADDHLEFTMDVFPPEFDAGLKVHKFLSRLFVIGDQEEGSALEIRFSDNNREDGTWSEWFEARMDEERPRIDDLGSFVKRAFHIRHTRPTKCRIRAIQLDMSVGMS